MTITVTLPDGRIVAWGTDEHIDALARALAGIRDTRMRQIVAGEHPRLLGEDMAAEVRRRAFVLLGEQAR